MKGSRIAKRAVAAASPLFKDVFKEKQYGGYYTNSNGSSIKTAVAAAVSSCWIAENSHGRLNYSSAFKCNINDLRSSFDNFDLAEGR